MYVVAAYFSVWLMCEFVSALAKWRPARVFDKTVRLRNISVARVTFEGLRAAERCGRMWRSEVIIIIIIMVVMNVVELTTHFW